MATLRELVAELGFEIDDTQAKSFKKTIDGIQTALNTFVVGKFLKSAGAIDNTFERTRRNIELLAGDKGLGLLEDAMENRVVSSATQMAEAVRNSLETLTDPKFTKATIATSEKLAVGLGKTAAEIQAIFDQAAASQTIDPLRELGLATQQEVEAINRMGISFTTATIKQEILNRITKKSASIQKQYAKALNRSDTQFNILLRNLSDLGKMVGEFINPIMTRLLIVFNKISEFFLTNPIGRFIVKVASLAAIFTVLLGAIASVVAVFKVLALLFSPVFIKIALIAAAVVALALVIEDLWLTFTDPAADTFFRGLIDPIIKAQGFIDTFIESVKALLKLTQFGILTDLAGGLFKKSGLAEKIPEFKEELFKMRGGGVGAIPQLQQGSGGNSSQNVSDNRKIEVNVTAGGGANGEEIASMVKNELESSDFMTKQYNSIQDTTIRGGK